MVMNSSAEGPLPTPKNSQPPTPNPQHLGRVLLIQAQWPARPMLKAELEQRGFDVLGADSVSLAVDLSMQRGFRPQAVVLDTADLVASPEEIERLRFLAGGVPLVLVRSPQYTSPEYERLGPARELMRPVTVGEIADAVASAAAT